MNAAILRFLRNFKEGNVAADSLEEGKYMKELDRVLELEREWIDVDAADLYEYDQDLYNKMVRYPLEVLAIFEIVLMDIASGRNPLYEKHVQVRVFNLRNSTSMRMLNPSGYQIYFNLGRFESTLVAVWRVTIVVIQNLIFVFMEKEFFFFVSGIC